MLFLSVLGSKGLISSKRMNRDREKKWFFAFGFLKDIDLFLYGVISGNITALPNALQKKANVLLTIHMHNYIQKKYMKKNCCNEMS